MQVSSEESLSRKSSTESREFWEETTQLLQELSILREEVAEISCPCRKQGCPFSHGGCRGGEGRPQGGRRATTKRRSTLHSIRTENSEMDCLARKNVASYLASLQQQGRQQGHQGHGPALQKSVQFRQDCLVTEEPLAGLIGEEYFVRSAPSRRAQRRHSCIRISNSYPTTMNSLAVPPNFLDLRYERWCGSLPNGMECQLGNSLDSLDSEKLQDIQKSSIRRQRAHQSSFELERW